MGDENGKNETNDESQKSSQQLIKKACAFGSHCCRYSLTLSIKYTLILQ